MKVVIINGSPRKNGNTAKMCDAFAKGFQKRDPQAEIVRKNLYDYTFQGCRSCFSCKLKDGKSYGRCIVKDEITDILAEANQADCLVMASPIYLMDISGVMKCFMERLCFPLGSYETGYKSLASKHMPVVTIYTMNCLPKDAPVAAMDMADLFIGHVFSNPQRVCAYNTYQFENYSKYVAEVFSEKEKREYRITQFPRELEEAFILGENVSRKLVTDTKC